MAKYLDETGLSRFWNNIKGRIGSASQEQVDAWLTAHPEATTTVQDDSLDTNKYKDSSITDAKLVQTGGVLSHVREKLGVITSPLEGKTDGVALNYSTGETFSASTWFTTDYIDISGFSSFVVSLPIMTASQDCGLAFYDSEHAYISGVPCRIAASEGHELVKIDSIPSNARYIRTSYRLRDIDSFEIFTEGSISLYQLAARERSAVGSAFVELEPVLTFDGYKVQGNTITSDANSTVAIYCIGSGHVRVENVGGSSVNCITANFYQNGPILDTQSQNRHFDNSNSIIEFDTNDQYLYLSKRYLGQDRTISVQFKPAGWDSRGSVMQMASENMHRLNCGFEPVHRAGFVFYQTGAVQSGDYGYTYSNYVNVEGVKRFVGYLPVLTSSQSGAGVAFYDSNKAYISGVSYPIDSSGGSGWQIYDVPSNAVYMRCSARIADYAQSVVKVDEIQAIKMELESDEIELTHGIIGGMSMFKTIGVISDSISVGWAKDKNGNNSRRNVDISWPQQMARMLGCTAYNLGASGVDPIEWFQSDYEFAEYCYTQYQSVGECDLYIIGLGLNGGTLGTVSDIDESDYTQNASTFYGQYARIIQMINDEHPDSIVMCLTEPTPNASSYDAAVRNICALSYINAELVDLDADYRSLFTTPEIVAQRQSDNLHYTPYGYSLLANAIVEAVNDYIAKNPDGFKYVGVATV